MCSDWLSCVVKLIKYMQPFLKGKVFCDRVFNNFQRISLRYLGYVIKLAPYFSNINKSLIKSHVPQVKFIDSIHTMNRTKSI